MKYKLDKKYINLANYQAIYTIRNYIPEIDIFIKHNYCNNKVIGIQTKHYLLKELIQKFCYCNFKKPFCSKCQYSSICEDGFFTTILNAFMKICKLKGEIKMTGTKANDIHLLIAMLEDNNLHFNIYSAVMDFIKKIAMAEGDIAEDELETINFGDINLSKEAYTKYKPVFDKIAEEYFPFYAVTSLDTEDEATPNIFNLKTMKVFTPLKDGDGVDENDYIVNIYIDWDDIDDIPEEYKCDTRLS